MATTEQRTAFGAALKRINKDAGHSQAWLAAEAPRLLGQEPLSQPYMSEIMKGLKEPKAEIAIAFERALGVAAGSLTAMLGFVSVEAQPAVSTVEAIGSDPLLDDRGRRSLLAAYHALIER